MKKNWTKSDTIEIALNTRSVKVMGMDSGVIMKVQSKDLEINGLFKSLNPSLGIEPCTITLTHGC